MGKIIEWIDGHNDQPICWLSGAAGFGKSAIARTIAALCEEEPNRLGASFFFWRGAGRRSVIANFISTLAYNLAFSVPETRPYIEKILLRDDMIVHRSHERQFQKLIVDPIRSVTRSLLPMIIVVDAIDECNDKQMMADLIGIIVQAFRDHRLPLRFFFTSRVEEHILDKFTAPPALAATYRLNLHDFDPTVDIRTFFRWQFSTIYEQKRRLMQNVTLPWPSESDLYTLVEKSSGSFAYASTLIKFVNDGRDLPHQRLRAGLESHSGLDPLYTQVLESARHSPYFTQVFTTIITITAQLSITDLTCLLQIEGGAVIHALEGVQSIIMVPEDDEQPVRLFHTSLRDFLTNKARSDHLFMNPPICHLSIAGDCLAVMTAHDGKDVYESGGLKFAAISWCDHMLSAIKDGSGIHHLSQNHVIMNKLINFVSRSFDSWVNSIIFHRKAWDILKNLDSLLSALKVRLLLHISLQTDGVSLTTVIPIPTKHDVGD
jgi:NACHT domain